MNWTTAYGLEIHISNLSHQHLSNIMHYHKHLLGTKPIGFIQNELEKRFGGIVLPYHPLISFKEEISELIKKGYTNGQIDADIIVDGKWVGKIKYT
jgi:hypothetical protein